jgi:peptide/nickel transport system substrate-binding protein
MSNRHHLGLAPFHQQLSRRTAFRLMGGGFGFAMIGGFGPLASRAWAADSGTLVVGANFVVQSLDPGRTVETTSLMILHSTNDSLVTFAGEDLKNPLPSLASSWDISDNGTTYTFKLRNDVKFASGNPLTAEDFKWSFERVRNLKDNPAFFLDPVTTIEALAPDTLVLRLKEPFPALIPILSSPALSALDSKLVREHGGDAGPDAATKDTAEPYLNGHSAGTGAFVMTSYVPDQEIVLERNPTHWRGAHSIERIVVRNITKAASQKALLSGGTLDIATGLSQDQVPALRETKGVVIKTTPAATTFYILLNNNPSVGGVFANPKVQQAVRHALDYDGIMQIAGSGAVRLAGIIPTNFAGARDPAKAAVSDPDRAKALLKEANLGRVQGAISYASDSVIWGVESNVLAQKIQSDLNSVGMDIGLDGLPRSPALQKYRDAKDQIGVWSWTADYPDATNFLVYAPGRTVGKRAGWSADASPEAMDLAELAHKTETEVDAAQRARLLEQVDDRLAAIGPYVPLFQPAVPYAFGENVEGVTFSSVWGVDFNTVKKVG